MTGAQAAETKKRADKLVMAVGGILAILLGMRRADATVTWDPGKARFIVDGRYVAMETVRRELRRFETSAGIRMRSLADELQAGTIDLDGWRASMKGLVASSHVVMGAMAAGSIAKAAAREDVQQRINEQTDYVDGFADDIKRKSLPTSTIKARSTSYLLSAAVTFGVVALAVRRESGGFTEAIRTLNARESCDGCIEAADQWMPIDEIPELGSMECSDWCRCEMDFR